ncbi:hypothetical protein Tco_1533955 [Tanacetum coccineum]
MIWLRAESPSTSHPLPLPPPIVLSHTKASVAMMRAVAPSTYILAPRSGIVPSKTPPSGTLPLLPILAPTSSPPLLLPSTDHRADMPEVCLPPRKRLCIALGPRYEVGESSYAPAARPTGGFRADYGFVATLDREIRQDTDEIYGRLDEAQEARAVLSGRLNLLGRDRRAHTHTALLMEREARLSPQQTEIAALRAEDHARQAQLVETLRLMSTLQTQVTTLQGQQGPISGPAQPEIPEEAGSSS